MNAIEAPTALVSRSELTQGDQPPIIINPTPAKMDIYLGFICSDNMPPTITPKAEVKINANDAPKKTVILLTSLSPANNIVAS